MVLVVLFTMEKQLKILWYSHPSAIAFLSARFPTICRLGLMIHEFVHSRLSPAESHL